MVNFPRDQQRPGTENNTSTGLLAREKWITNPSSLDLLAHRPIACSFLLSLWLIFAFFLIHNSAMAPRVLRRSYCENFPPFPVDAFDRDLSDSPKMTKWIRFVVNETTFSFFLRCKRYISLRYHHQILQRHWFPDSLCVYEYNSSFDVQSHLPQRIQSFSFKAPVRDWHE